MDRVLSVDLGTKGDYTAIVLLEVVPRRQEKGKPLHLHEDYTVINEIHCRFMERMELGTKYTEVVERVKEIYLHPENQGRTLLIVDETGVGIPVIEMMRSRGLPPIGITITGGKSVTNKDTGYTVPKRDIVSTLQVIFQSRRLKLSRGLPEEAVRHFVHELNNFKAKITESKHDTYEAAKESDHDDLVMSMGMGVWYINRVYGEKLEYSEKLTGNIEYDVLNYGIR
jgi:hypothetical protein